MSLTSMYFVLFILILLPVYYLVPQKIRWYVLLVASIIFYLFSGWTNIFYVLGVTAVAYLATIKMQKHTDAQKDYLAANKDKLSRDEKKAYKAEVKKKNKNVMLIAVVLIAAVLVFFKLLSPVNKVLTAKNITAVDIIVPLGLSYFSLQTIGYIVDVYWNKVTAEKNPLKLLLFVSFFPQVTQGPISDFNTLRDELFRAHTFTYENYSRGFQRLIWGYFKKLVIADIMAPYVSDLFANYKEYTGITLILGMFVIMIQLYADFSGYMDIVCGICEMLDIKLSENFERPFFSKSLAEFWRRWHITLGAWFRKYIFFTVGTSRLAKKISKNVKGDTGDKLVSTIALLVIWTTIGAWHGLNLNYVLWGLASGIIMIISVWLEDFYAKCREKLHIKDESKLFNLFRMVRTFALVSALETFSDAGSFYHGCKYFLCMLSNIKSIPHSLWTLVPFADNEYYLILLFLSVGLVFIVEMHEYKKPFRDYFNKIPMPIRVFILAAMFILLGSFGLQANIANDGGFLYAVF